MKKPKMVFNYDKKKLLEKAEQLQMNDYIKTKKEFDWAKFKKNLVIQGNNIVDKENGEIIDLEGLGVTEKPAEFKVEV